MYNFFNKVVLVTGASSGIGSDTAILFAKHKANVTLVGRNEENLKRIADICEKQFNSKAQIIVADLSVEEDVKSIIPKTLSHWGKLDVLINNAGIAKNDSITGENFLETFTKTMDTNLRSTVILTHLAVPHLVKTKGNIINISSIGATKPLHSMISYCTSKAAIDQFTKTTALEIAAQGVRVNIVSPGPVRTKIYRLFDDINRMREILTAARPPLKDFAMSEEVAELIVFLASDKASCITGSTYLADCGLMLGPDPTKVG